MVSYWEDPIFKYSVETKLSREYHELYFKLWNKYKQIDLTDKTTWERIPKEEIRVMVFEPPLKDYGTFIDAG